MLQCFNSRDDNLPQNWVKFQTRFSQPLVDFIIGNSYGGQYGTCIAPHKSVKIWGQPGAEKSGSEIDPY